MAPGAMTEPVRGRRGRAPTQDETRLWRQATADVAPLDPRPAPDPQPEPQPAPEAPAVPPRAVAAPAPARPRPAPPPLAPGKTVDIDRRTDERLRRGRMAIDARIDLHGMTQDEAHGALSAFVERGVAAGWRCVLVITGKGDPAAGGGVLRRAVPRWLNEPRLRGQVVALHQAQAAHGGGGALYLLLKRQRDPAP